MWMSGSLLRPVAGAVHGVSGQTDPLSPVSGPARPDIMTFKL